MEGHRRLTRKRLALYLDAVDIATDKTIGKVVDLTPAGFLLVSSARVETGAVLHLRILLPVTTATKGFIEVEARSLWSRVNANPQVWDTGFEITGMTEIDQRVLSRVILDYGLDG
jgi:hypothetical protein